MGHIKASPHLQASYRPTNQDQAVVHLNYMHLQADYIHSLPLDLLAFLPSTRCA